MLVYVPSFGRNPRGSPDILLYPVSKACQRHDLGTLVLRCLGVARSASSPNAAQALCLSRLGSVLCVFGFVFLPPLRHFWQGSVGCVFGYSCCLYLAFPGWVLRCVRLGYGLPGWCLACVGTGFIPAPPFLARACGPCLGTGLDAICLGLVCACMIGYGSPLYAAIRGLKLWRLVVSGCPLKSGLSWLGCRCLWWGVRGRSWEGSVCVVHRLPRVWVGVG